MDSWLTSPISSFIISLVLNLHFCAYALSCTNVFEKPASFHVVTEIGNGKPMVSDVGIRCALQLRGGGKFPLKRMMRHNVDKMGKEERVAALEEIHKLMPFLDEGNDQLTREVLKERERKKQQQVWAAIKAQKRQAREKKAQEAAASEEIGPPPRDPIQTIHLPKMRPGASLIEMARALEPHVFRPRPNTRLVHHEAASAMAALATALAQPPPPPTSVRRLSLRTIDRLASVVACSLQEAPLSESVPAIKAVARLRSENMDMGAGCQALAQQVFHHVATGPPIRLLGEEDLCGICVLLQQAVEDGILAAESGRAQDAAKEGQNATIGSGQHQDPDDVQDQTLTNTADRSVEALKGAVAQRVAAVSFRIPQKCFAVLTVTAVLRLFEVLEEPLPNKLAQHLQPIGTR